MWEPYFAASGLLVGYKLHKRTHTAYYYLAAVGHDPSRAYTCPGDCHATLGYFYMEYSAKNEVVRAQWCTREGDDLKSDNVPNIGMFKVMNGELYYCMAGVHAGANPREFGINLQATVDDCFTSQADVTLSKEDMYAAQNAEGEASRLRIFMSLASHEPAYRCERTGRTLLLPTKFMVSRFNPETKAFDDSKLVPSDGYRWDEQQRCFSKPTRRGWAHTSVNTTSALTRANGKAYA